MTTSIKKKITLAFATLALSACSLNFTAKGEIPTFSNDAKDGDPTKIKLFYADGKPLPCPELNNYLSYTFKKYNEIDPIVTKGSIQLIISQCTTRHRLKVSPQKVKKKFISA